MDIETREQDGVAVVSIDGEIDSKTAPEAQEKLIPFVEKHSRIVMDLSAVTFMSSAGLRMMLLIYRHATAQDGKVALVGLSEQIKDTMDATGFLDFFELCDTIENAVAAAK
jgi:anti-sigma B factor antagonist